MFIIRLTSTKDRVTCIDTEHWILIIQDERGLFHYYFEGLFTCIIGDG